jgi:hypothetical protein
MGPRLLNRGLHPDFRTASRKTGLTADPMGVSTVYLPSVSFEHHEEILPGEREIKGANERPKTGNPIYRLTLA